MHTQNSLHPKGSFLLPLTGEEGCACRSELHICTFVETRGGCWMSSSKVYHWTWSPLLPTAWLARKLQQSAYLHFPVAGITDMHHHTWLLTWFLGIQTWTLIPTEHAFYQLSRLPALIFLFLFLTPLILLKIYFYYLNYAYKRGMIMGVQVLRRPEVKDLPEAGATCSCQHHHYHHHPPPPLWVLESECLSSVRAAHTLVTESSLQPSRLFLKSKI